MCCNFMNQSLFLLAKCDQTTMWREQRDIFRLSQLPAVLEPVDSFVDTRFLLLLDCGFLCEGH